ncbi:MAG: restriction endonuclease subunit S [Candidatus Methanoperedens sp.]
MEAHERRTLPEGWEWKRLGDIASIIMGQSPPGSTYNEIGDGFPFLQGNAEFNDKYPKNIKYTTEPSKIAPKNSILVSVRAPVGDINIANIDYCIGRGLASISFISGDNKYLFYLLNYLKPKIEDKGIGSTFQAISKSVLYDIQIPLPPLPTQSRIVSVLEKAEETKKLRAQADELTKKLLQSLYLEMFGEPARNPKGWEKVRLNDVCEKIQDGTHFSPQDQTGEVPYVTAKNIRPWGIDLTDITYVTREFHEEIYRRCDPKKGDVIYIKDGVTAGLAKVNSLDFEFSMLSSIAMIRPKSSFLNSYYLEYYLNYPATYKRIMERKSGSAITRLILREIKDINIHLPPFPLQQKFARIVEKIESMRQSQNQSKQQIEDLFSALMQKAFRGELER